MYVNVCMYVSVCVCMIYWSQEGPGEEVTHGLAARTSSNLAFIP